MCGIAGVFGADAAQRAGIAANALQHRGPDGMGCYHDPDVDFTLSHRRLSITDRTEAAAQPMRYRGRYVAVHNGELYNHKELKAELEEKGFSFCSLSDTEVLLAAYAFWGKDCLQHFDGAFAFAIWDEREKALFAARDRMGEKPFFFTLDHHNCLLFASEIKGLHAAGVLEKVDRGMLYNYLTLGYTQNPYNKTATFYEGIQQLPPAHFLCYKWGGDAVLLQQYWSVDTTEKKLTDTTALSIFGQLLTASVRHRLRSNVPTGISLSGGLDSSTIAALCRAQAAPHYTHQCFTASFPGYEKDETAHAAAIASHFGLQHHVVPIGVSDLLSNMEMASRHQEAPVQSASVLAQWQVYGAAKSRGITVLLDGQGADELLAGYHKYYLWYWRELYARRQLHKSGALTAAANVEVKEPFGFIQKMAALFPHFAASLWQTHKERKAVRQRYLHPLFVQENKSAFAYAQPTMPTLNGVLHYNCFTSGLEELLRYADRNSMAHAVEIRLPFLAHGLVEFAFTLPPYFKIRNGYTKWLLREWMKETLPPEVTWRKDKVGFEPPQQQWMQDAQVQRQIGMAKEILVAEEILQPLVLKQKIQPKHAHAADNMDWRYWSASYLFR